MKKHRIYIVDDDADLIIALQQLFSLNGFDCQTASSAFEAEELFRVAEPDLLVIDIMMPFWNGLDFCAKLREKGVQCPIMVLTAEGSEATRRRAEAIRPHAFMTKPFDPDQLVMRAKIIAGNGDEIPGSSEG